MADDDKKGRWSGFDFGGGGEPGGRRRFSIWLLIPIALLVYLVYASLGASRGQEIAYSQFVSLAQRDAVTEVTISTDSVTGVYQEDGEDVPFKATLPPNFDTSTLTELLTQHKVEVRATQPSPFLGWIAQILFFGLIIGLFYFFMFRRIGGGARAALNLG